MRQSTAVETAITVNESTTGVTRRISPISDAPLTAPIAIVSFAIYLFCMYQPMLHNNIEKIAKQKLGRSTGGPL